MLYQREGKNSFPVLLIYVELTRYTFQVCINLFQFIQYGTEVMVLSFRLDFSVSSSACFTLSVSVSLSLLDFSNESHVLYSHILDENLKKQAVR